MSQNLERKICSRCHQEFGCGAAIGKCWCMDVPTASILSGEYDDCLCAECLAALSKTQPLQPLTENTDYYYENGFMVFTKEYLLKRGYCCKNNCRHCPYPKN